MFYLYIVTKALIKSLYDDNIIFLVLDLPYKLV